MPIKRRLTKSAVRKELQVLCDMPHGQAKETLRREGKFWYSDFDEAEGHQAAINDIFEDDKNWSEPNKPGKEGRHILTPATRNEIGDRVQQMLDMISDLSDQVEELEERVNAQIS